MCYNFNLIIDYLRRFRCKFLNLCNYFEFSENYLYIINYKDIFNIFLGFFFINICIVI